MRKFQKVKIEVTGPKKAQLARTFWVDLHQDVVLEVPQLVGSKFLFTKLVDIFHMKSFRNLQNLRFGNLKIYITNLINSINKVENYQCRISSTKIPKEVYFIITKCIKMREPEMQSLFPEELKVFLWHFFIYPEIRISVFH